MKKTTTRYTLSWLMFMALVIASCHEDVTPTPFSFSRKFTGTTSRTWSISYFEYTTGGEVADRFSVSCAADDQFTFYANTERVLAIATGSRRCYEDPEPSTIQNNWSYESATATLTMMIPVFSVENSYPFFIREIDEDDMVLEIFLDYDNTESYRIHFKLTDEN